MQLTDLLPPESQEPGKSHFNKLNENGRARDEFAYRHKNGEIRYWSVDAVKLSSTRFIGFVQDITQRKAVEEVKQRYAELQSVLKEVADAAVSALSLSELYPIVHRLVGRILPARNFYIALLDDAAGQVVRPYCVDEMYFVPRQRPVGKGMTEYVMRQGKVMFLNQSELTRLRKNGEISQLEAPAHEYLGAPLKDSTGKSFGVIALSATEHAFRPEDVEVFSIIAAQVSLAMECKRAEKALLDHDAFLASLLDAIPAPIFYKDIEGRYIGINKAFEKFNGLTLQEIVGKSVFDISPLELAKEYHDRDLELLHLGGTQVYETQMRDTLSVVHDVVFHKATFANSDGAIQGLVGAILDISDRKKAEEELRENRAARELEGKQAEEKLCETNAYLENLINYANRRSNI